MILRHKTASFGHSVYGFGHRNVTNSRVYFHRFNLPFLRHKMASFGPINYSFGHWNVLLKTYKFLNTSYSTGAWKLKLKNLVQ